MSYPCDNRAHAARAALPVLTNRDPNALTSQAIMPGDKCPDTGCNIKSGCLSWSRPLSL